MPMKYLPSRVSLSLRGRNQRSSRERKRFGAADLPWFGGAEAALRAGGTIGVLRAVPVRAPPRPEPRLRLPREWGRSPRRARRVGRGAPEPEPRDRGYRR